MDYSECYRRSGAVPGGIFGDQLVCGVFLRRDLQAIGKGGVKFLKPWLDAHALRAGQAVAEGRLAAAWDCAGGGVEAEDFEAASAESLQSSPRGRGFFLLASALGLPGIAPAGVEDPAIVDHGCEQDHGDERQDAAKTRDNPGSLGHTDSVPREAFKGAMYAGARSGR